jgi:hypothetical protein
MAYNSKGELFTFLTTKRLLKCFHDSIVKAKQHLNQNSPALGLDGTFNTTKQTDIVAVIINAQDCNRKTYLACCALCNGEKAEHITKTIDYLFT